MITTVLIIALVAAIAKIVTLAKIGALKRLLGFDVVIDLMAGMLFAWLFMGTLTGMAIAATAGLLFSLMIWGYKKLNGYDRLVIRGWRFRWEHVEPVWKTAN